MNYTHLTQEERYQIYALLRDGFSKFHIALRLECAHLRFVERSNKLSISAFTF